MKAKLNELFTELSGKMCKRDGSTILAHNSQTDVQYAFHIHKKRTGKPSADQLAQQALFTKTIEKIKAAMADPEQWAEIKAAYKKNNKGYRTLNGFAFNYFYKQD